MYGKFKRLKLAFSSRAQLVKFLETAPDASGNPDTARNKWQNKDLDISPPKDRTWAWYDYAAFWWSYGFAPGSWYIAASLLAAGLSPGHALGSIFLGYFFGAVGVVLHSRGPAMYHFGFPVESRIVWGLRGAYFPVIIRAMTALVWAGVTIAQGGYNTAVLLRSILVYWVLTCWLIIIPIPKLRRLFEIKSFILPPVMFGLFGYCMVKGRGYPHRDMYDIDPKKRVALSWAMLSGINAGLGKTTTLMVNQPDIARYARSKMAPVLSQLIMFPLASTCCSAMGIYATQSIYNVWGNLDWNPWTLNHDMLDHNFSHSFRAGIAIMNLVFLYANAITEQGQIWLNIRRAMWLCYVLAICICPWYILASASGFLRFLNGYSIFLGPFLGMALTDYLVVRKGNVFVHDLFKEKGRYWYSHGVAWRPFVTYVLSVAFVLPGFVATFGYRIAGGAGWTHLYDFSWFYICVVSSVVYFVLSYVGDYAKEEKAMSYESLASIAEELYGEEQQRTTVLEVNLHVEGKDPANVV
ncbi:hypothetical protein N7470_006406 [Penicillium chermesinum]|nr:hypothetical protein N7470_006406 [Penicillium chermesinum]